MFSLRDRWGHSLMSSSGYAPENIGINVSFPNLTVTRPYDVSIAAAPFTRIYKEDVVIHSEVSCSARVKLFFLQICVEPRTSEMFAEYITAEKRRYGVTFRTVVGRERKTSCDRAVAAFCLYCSYQYRESTPWSVCSISSGSNNSMTSVVRSRRTPWVSARHPGLAAVIMVTWPDASSILH